MTVEVEIEIETETETETEIMDVAVTEDAQGHLVIAALDHLGAIWK